jgi:hypothetical protein
MKKLLLAILVIASGVSFAQTATSTFFKEADAFFEKYVMDGKVDYKSLKNNMTSLDALYTQVNEMNLSGVDDNVRKAFYLNAYNVAVIRQVTKYYPLKSPLDKSGFFDQVKHVIAGESMTLNSLEIKKIILPYKDARIHFALACAAVSCPKLASFAYQPTELEKQLNDRTKLSINDDTFIRVKSNAVEVSQIFKWYVRDFTNGGSSVISFINTYRDNKISASDKLGYYEYDWKLNEM